MSSLNKSDLARLMGFSKTDLDLLNDLSGTELSALDGITPGTATASKALVLNSSKGISTITTATITTLTSPNIAGNVTFADGTTDVDIASHDGTNGFKLGGVLQTALAAEVNLLDISAQTETTIAAGTASATKRITQLDSSGGAGSFTLAAPDSTMIGQIKIIEMVTAGNALTLSLANVQGGSAATTASFDAANETLTLIGGKNKWTVLNETGVTLS